MTKKQPIKKEELNPLPLPLKPLRNETKKTRPIKQKDHDKEKKPEFQELLNKEEKSASLNESSLPGSEDELIEPDENIVEVCADVIAIPFAIWHELNKNVQPLSEKEKQNISKPLAKVVAKYDLGKYMKEEFVLCFYLGSAIYGRTKVPKAIKKDDKDDNRKEGTRKDEPGSRINPGEPG